MRFFDNFSRALNFHFQVLNFPEKKKFKCFKDVLINDVNGCKLLEYLPNIYLLIIFLSL